MAFLKMAEQTGEETLMIWISLKIDEVNDMDNKLGTNICIKARWRQRSECVV